MYTFVSKASRILSWEMAFFVSFIMAFNNDCMVFYALSSSLEVEFGEGICQYGAIEHS